MAPDRSTRTLIAAVLFTLALFLVMNYIVDQRPLIDFWLPVVLVAAGLAATTAERVRRRIAPESASGARAYTVRDYTIAGGAATREIAGPEQAGEVNVREPLDEQESQPVIPAPETLTPDVPEDSDEEAADPDVIAAPETLTPPVAPAGAPEPPLEEERELDDIETAGDFAPPKTVEGALNPPSETDTGAIVKPQAPIQQKDPARHEMPTGKVQVPKPERSEAQRLEQDQTILQPSQTAENEFQSGEHVAYTQPTTMPPVTTVTTGEGFGEGIEPMEPEKKTVLDSTSAPPQPTDAYGADSTRPDIADDVLNDRASEGVAADLAPREEISPTSASGKASTDQPDDLTMLHGIGGKMQEALRRAGIDSYVKLSMTSDDELRAAVEAAGMRLAPNLTTWREQALFLARGDRAGFDAMKNALRGQTVSSGEDQDDQAKTNFIDTGRR